MRSTQAVDPRDQIRLAPASPEPADAELYRRIAETIPQKIWVADPHGNATFFNTRMTEYTGSTLRELAGWSRLEVIHPADRPECERRWKHSLATGEPYEAEARLRRRDGEYRRHLDAALPLKDARGRIVQWFGSCTDIDEIKAVEQYRALTRMSSDFFWATGPDHRFLAMEYGDRFPGPMESERYLGRARWEVPYLSPDEEGWRRHREDLGARRPIRGFAFSRRARDGSERHYEVQGDPHFGPGGEFLGYRGTGRDVTDPVRARRALEESEERFRLFMDHSPALAWIKDSKLRYVYVNRAHQDVHGISADRMLARDDFAIWPQATARAFRESDETALRSCDAVVLFERAPTREGKEGRFLVVKFKVPDPTGAPGVGGIAIDVSQYAEAVQKLEESRARIRDLMQRLVSVQEAERRRIAADLHDAVSQNLTAIGVDLEVLRGALPPMVAVQNGLRLDDLRRLAEETALAVRQVMQDLRPPVLDDYGLVPALDWYAQQFATRSGIRAAAHGGLIEPRLPADTELALFRIAQEALANCAKHSGATEVRICVSAREGRIRMTVEDNGRGFAEPDGARAARRGGFGLPAMRERAEAAGGSLRVEFPGVGTRIVVELPRGDPDRPG
jgi:PAS domain S-box-containing protein